jgi:hypothetical protein
MIENALNKIEHMNQLTAFGLIAVSLMLIFYALEERSRWFVLAFACSCVMAAVYGFRQGAWPFGLVEGIWSLVAIRRWYNGVKKKSGRVIERCNVGDFLEELGTLAQPAGRGDYTFPATEGGHHGAVQFIVDGPGRLRIHRLWTMRPGQGSGSKILRTLCDLADRHDVELLLKVIPIGRKPYPMDRDDLFTWYQKFGFEGSHREMRRQPRSVELLVPTVVCGPKEA